MVHFGDVLRGDVKGEVNEDLGSVHMSTLLGDTHGTVRFLAGAGVDVDGLHADTTPIKRDSATSTEVLEVKTSMTTTSTRMYYLESK